MKHKLSKIALFILCAALSATAQTSADLKTKFGKSLEAFEVRPNVLMTVEYAADGQLLEIIIEPRHTERTETTKTYNVTAFSSLSPKVVTEILDEIVPLEERGRKLNQMTFNSSCNAITFESYETLEINRAYKCGQLSGTSDLYAVRVRWKKRQ